MTKCVCDIKGFEDYSGKMTHFQKGYSQYAGCANYSIIRDGSIERLAEYTAADDCAIIAAPATPVKERASSCSVAWKSRRLT